MNHDTKRTATTPLVAPYERHETDEAPREVDTDAPVSTGTDGERVDLPDLGGQID